KTPKEEKPETPVKPEKPAKPSKPVTPNKPENPSKPVTPGGKLPQTGEEQFLYMIAFGALFLIAGGTILFRNKRREA
ncbi:LPXTG cell wall anchor domain-containing protein, partial [Microvirga sp. 3-52]|nr:LPXTG cell wall anchor domain-containing protein [Microvirga sp. 3-52]